MVGLASEKGLHGVATVPPGEAFRMVSPQVEHAVDLVKSSTEAGETEPEIVVLGPVSVPIPAHGLQ
jgi:hypothetical protein